MIRALLLTVLTLALAACGPAQTGDGPEAGASADQAETEEPAGTTEPEGDAGEDGDGDGTGSDETDEDAATAPGQGLTLLTPVFALAWMGEQLAPDADVAFLLAGGGDPHDLELSPSERALLETAEVVAYAGDLGFMPQFESAVDSATGQVVDLEQVAGEERVMRFDHGDDDDHADDDHADDDHADADDGRGELADPHLWFDTTVLADTAVELGDAFAAADPANAEAFRENAAALAAEMDELTDEIDDRLAGCTHDSVIVSHEAYGYLLERRGIEQEGISGAGGHAEASPQRLAELTERIRAEQIPAVAAEPLHGRADAEALAAEAGVDLVEVNPLEDVSDDEYERGFPQMLLDQVDAFAAALGCEGA